MEKIINYLSRYIKEDFNLSLYFSVFIFLSIAFYFNFTHDLKRNWINTYSGQTIQYLYVLLFLIIPYSFTFLIQGYLTKDFKFLRNKQFWVLSIFAIVILTLQGGSKHLPFELLSYLDVEYTYKRWIFLCLSNIQRIAFIALPVILFKLIYQNELKSIYGLTLKNFDWKPYFYMLLIMLPLIALASFEPSFLKTYPIYKPGILEASGEVPKYTTISIFEFLYALRFIAVEIMFRGFLVIGLAKVIGSRAILPMVVLYAFWHFGKPMGEAIGSIFGGYILGIIALRSQSIFGGILIHIGVALLMELVAHLQV